MSRHTYAWYRIPDRIVLGLYALAASVWRDWFPRRMKDTEMTKDEKTLQIVSKLYDTRDAMCRLLGEKYEARSAQAQDVIRLVMKKRNCDELDGLQRVLDFAKTLSAPDDAAVSGMAIAAYLDMLEAKV